MVLPPLAYLLAVAVLRHAEGGAASGHGPLVLIPLFWVALYWERAQVATVVVGIVLVFMLPILVIGPPGYPSTEWRRLVVWLVVAPTVGLVVNDLVRRIRTEASANERRARALDAVAGISRGLSHGADARSRICEAALTVSEAAAAFLVELDGAGRLRSTAVVGVLVVLWRRRVAGPDHFSAMVTTLLATEAGVTIERSDLLLQLDEMARTDKLTGLRNRRAFDELLEREMARSKRTGESLVLALVDLDRFKSYNDNHGHQAGDELLAAAASAWREVLRDVDVLARWGGESWCCCPGRGRPMPARRSNACGPGDENSGPQCDGSLVQLPLVGVRRHVRVCDRGLDDHLLLDVLPVDRLLELLLDRARGTI